jgi:hypothetical protein
MNKQVQRIFFHGSVKFTIPFHLMAGYWKRVGKWICCIPRHLWSKWVKLPLAFSTTLSEECAGVLCNVPPLHRTDSTDHPASREWPGGIQLVSSVIDVSRNIPQEYWHLHRSYRMHKHTDLREQDFVNSPHLWHPPRLANFRYSWSRRRYAIPRTIAAATGWAEVDTWPLIHGGCYHVTEVGGSYGWWDSRWRSFKMTRTLWNYSNYRPIHRFSASLLQPVLCGDGVQEQFWHVYVLALIFLVTLVRSRNSCNTDVTPGTLTATRVT